MWPSATTNCAGLYIIVAFCHNKLVWLRRVITQIVTVYIRHYITVAFCHNKLCWISYNCGLLPQQTVVWLRRVITHTHTHKYIHTHTHKHTHLYTHTYTHTYYCDIVTVYIRHHIIVAFCHNKLCWTSYNFGLLPQQTVV